MGLDYSPRVIGTDNFEAVKDIQRMVFCRQAALAIKFDLPLNIHSRSGGHHAIQLVTRSIFFLY